MNPAGGISEEEIVINLLALLTHFVVTAEDSKDEVKNVSTVEEPKKEIPPNP